MKLLINNKVYISPQLKWTKRVNNFHFQSEYSINIYIMNNQQMQSNSLQEKPVNCNPPLIENRFNQVKKRLSVNLKKIIQQCKTDVQQFQKDSPNKSKVYKNLQEVKCMMDVKSQTGFKQEYQLGKKLGEGCHSSVYLCQSQKENKLYAVKVTKQKDMQLFHCMRQSYRILKRLQHQNIIQAKNLFTNQKTMTCHLVLQYCEWENLEFYIKKKSYKFQGQQVAHILRQLLKTVSYMHSSGVCHRDLKPDNILYDKVRRKIKIIDFQIARIKKYSNQSLQMMSKTGCLRYRAPQMFHAIYDQRVDIWSIGIIAYQLMTKRHPFTSQYDHQQIDNILNNEPELQDLSVWQQDLIKKLLHKNPEKRATVSQALSSPYLLVNSKLSDSPHPKTPSMMKSPSLGKNQFEKSLKQISFSSKFYDDQVTNQFLGGTQGDIGVIIQHE